MATYTITETCTGDKAANTPAVVPAGFVVTTVSCDVGKSAEIEITCLGVQPTGPTGVLTVTIQGNGVTATITATPPQAPGPGQPGQPGMPGGALPVTADCPNGGDMGGMGPGSNGTMPSPPITAGAPSVRSLAAFRC